MRSLEISPEQFRLLAKQVCDLVADYLETIDARPVAPSVTGAETEKTFRAPLPEKALGPESLNDLQNVLRYSRGNNGRFFGYVLGSGEPVGAGMLFLGVVAIGGVRVGRRTRIRRRLSAGGLRVDREHD